VFTLSRPLPSSLALSGPWPHTSSCARFPSRPGPCHTYIAPERLKGGPGDFRADVFSVGALWYTMITARTLPDPLEADRHPPPRAMTLTP
jgi:serine/threonine protein kinase